MKYGFAKIRRNYLRACLRGYRKTKQLDKLNYLRLLKNDAVNIKLPSLNKHNASYISEFEPYDTEVVVRQYILQYYMGQKFVRSIFLSYGRNVPAVVALPSSWRKFLQINGIDLSERKSHFAWSLEVILHLLYGYYVFGNLVLHNLINKAPIAKDDESYVYFYGLSSSNLPSELKDSFDIINWYSRINCRDKSIAEFRHSVTNSANKVIDNLSIEFDPPPYCKIKSLRKKIFYHLGRQISIYRSQRCSFWKMVACPHVQEIVKAKAVQLADCENLASEYLFYHSGSVYRPLWTYVVEAKGSDVICYFYSSFDQPQLRKGSVPQKYEWSPSTWPKILVWDAYQKELLARDLPSNTNFTVCGPIF